MLTAFCGKGGGSHVEQAATVYYSTPRALPGVVLQSPPAPPPFGCLTTVDPPRGDVLVSRLDSFRPPHENIHSIFCGGLSMSDIESTPAFNADTAAARLRGSAHPKAANYYAMYSSVLGGIVTDPALMVVPLDDHMVHRGHAVFDTAILANGLLYQLDQHLERFLRSAEMARIALPFPVEKLRRIIIDTAAASRRRDASVRYWLSAGPGGFGLTSAECVGSSFYVVIFGAEFYPDWFYTRGLK